MNLGTPKNQAREVAARVAQSEGSFEDLLRKAIQEAKAA